MCNVPQLKSPPAAPLRDAALLSLLPPRSPGPPFFEPPVLRAGEPSAPPPRRRRHGLPDALLDPRLLGPCSGAMLPFPSPCLLVTAQPPQIATQYRRESLPSRTGRRRRRRGRDVAGGAWAGPRPAAAAGAGGCARRQPRRCGGLLPPRRHSESRRCARTRQDSESDQGGELVLHLTFKARDVSAPGGNSCSARGRQAFRRSATRMAAARTTMTPAATPAGPARATLKEAGSGGSRGTRRRTPACPCELRGDVGPARLWSDVNSAWMSRSIAGGGEEPVYGGASESCPALMRVPGRIQ